MFLRKPNIHLLEVGFLNKYQIIFKAESNPVKFNKSLKENLIDLNYLSKIACDHVCSVWIQCAFCPIGASD